MEFTNIKNISNNNESYTIGIGASAGGLEALKRFFDGIPENCPHSFVIIQHLSPDYKSLMAELLAKNTPMPIHEVIDEMPVESGHIYLIPPKYNMTIENGKLTLKDRPSGQSLSLPIDIFFRSMAKDQGDKAIGIILTGTGSDGTRGVRAIKEAGGLIMVQNPDQAAFNGMPLSAIRTGLVDFISPIEQLPQQLLSFLEHPTANGLTQHHIENNEATLARLLEQVRRLTGLDFSNYKRPTLARRIERRMGLNKCKDFQDYLNLISQEPQEVDVLSREFLIGVTSFFRDHEVWNILEKKLLPELVEAKESEAKPLRVWCAACSTGEEVYTLAILIKEVLQRHRQHVDVKIFATDIAKHHLEIGSKGVYPASIVADVAPQRLRHYFICKDDEYHVTENLRKMVIFSPHNILQDPPFSHMDLVICRNLLIYLQPNAQKRAMNALHYALNFNGTLLLGSSETPGEFKHLFQNVDQKLRIYRNLQVARMGHLESLSYPDVQRLPLKAAGTMQKTKEYRLAEMMNEVLVDELGLAILYVDENFDILHAVGEVRRYVILPEKGFSVNLLKMVPNNISVILNTAVRKAKQQHDKVMHKGLRLVKDSGLVMLNLLVYPNQTVGESDYSYYLIVFMPQAVEGHEKAVIEPQSGIYSDPSVTELEAELLSTRASLKTAITEVETANEELQATNEELLAANEELQSTNEELQSMNEELYTVNTEHQQKIEDLASLNADIDNLMKSSEIGTIFLDHDMNIRKFTPSIQEQFNLQEHDVGRPISHFTSKFGEVDNKNILENAQKVFSSNLSYDEEVQTDDGKWYLVKTAPFRNSHLMVDGVVISFVDVTKLKEVEHKYAYQNAAFEQVLEGTMAGYWECMVQENTEYMSPTFKKMFGYEDHEIENTPEAWQGLIHPDDLPMVLEARNKHFETKGAFPYDNEVRYYHKDGKIVWVYCRGKVIEWDEKGKPLRMVGSHVDISVLKSAHSELEQSNKELTQFAYIASHDLREPLLTINSFIDVLKQDYESKFDSEGKEVLEFIYQSTTRMNSLIEALLAYSRIGRDTVLTLIDYNALIKSILDDISFSIAEADASFEIGELPKLIGNEPEIRAVFQNLIANSLKFRRRNINTKIKISAYQEDRYCKFVVQDNGIGIEEEHQERIFQLFQRLHTNGEYEGTGIGLSYCKKIVENNGGRIWVESHPNEGSIFYFTIPI